MVRQLAQKLIPAQGHLRGVEKGPGLDFGLLKQKKKKKERRSVPLIFRLAPSVQSPSISCILAFPSVISLGGP